MRAPTGIWVFYGYSSDSLPLWDVITPNIIIVDRFACEIMITVNVDDIL
jgi:hypothetical protein